MKIYPYRTHDKKNRPDKSNWSRFMIHSSIKRHSSKTDPKPHREKPNEKNFIIIHTSITLPEEEINHG